MKKIKDFVILLFLFLSFWYLFDEVYYFNDLDNFVFDETMPSNFQKKYDYKGKEIEIYDKMFYFIVDKVENHRTIKLMEEIE